MSLLLAKQLVRYRTVLVALSNAGIAWIVLIIAPLGLFAVITCTALIFLGSLATGWLGDLALTTLLKAGDRSFPRSIYSHQNPAAPASPHEIDQQIATPHQRELPPL